MSVLICGRTECEHVMCDRMILGGSKYICSDCWEELLEYKKTWPDRMAPREVHDRIREFMNTTAPGTFLRKLDRDGIDAEFDRLTNNRGFDE